MREVERCELSKAESRRASRSVFFSAMRWRGGLNVARVVQIDAVMSYIQTKDERVTSANFANLDAVEGSAFSSPLPPSRRRLSHLPPSLSRVRRWQE